MAIKNVLDKLHQDHINASKLLDRYEEQLEKVKQGDSPDYMIMRDIMRYMNGYPDIIHHPLEEVIFEKLEEKNNELAGKIGKLYREHSEIDDAGDNLYEILSKITAGEVTSLDVLRENSEKYLELMRSHMDMEESEIFPKIRELLTENDWETIDLALAEQNDPLFGSKVEEEYQELYKSITDL